MTLIAAVDIWQILIPAAFFGLGVWVRARFVENAAKAASAREVEHWQQALLHVIDVTEEIGRQNRNDSWDRPLVSKKVKLVSVTLEGILHGHVGPRVAPHISALRDVYEHFLGMGEIYSGSLTERNQRMIIESVASLDLKVYDLRDALK